MPEPQESTRLKDGLLSMAELPTAPADPLPAIQGRIVRRRRVRFVGTTVVLAACATLAFAIVPALNGTSTIEPAGPVTANAPVVPDDQAEPFSDRKYTKLPEANAYRPGYYVASGKEADKDWNALSTLTAERGCLVIEPQTLNDSFVCFDDWTDPAKRADWFTTGLRLGAKPDFEPLDKTLVLGAVSIEARSVRIETANGQLYTADAVATPNSDQLRFFAFVVPQRDAKVTAVTPLDENGEVADPPVDMPPPLECGKDVTCAEHRATPTPAK
ncbi:hypothetical protein [Tenggerimyces flavus]|uniref:Uncharacterized protein n=1 Tax=Tenggerimyces flavus TaxID=1708749 RepID=A0ABV7YH43_9ACTN|nr:hypothetical protein [Tenggerimyces flavus]MBM7789195.1 hypothetical protein [Tenggerimyces flavus]